MQKLDILAIVMIVLFAILGITKQDISTKQEMSTQGLNSDSLITTTAAISALSDTKD